MKNKQSVSYVLMDIVLVLVIAAIIIIPINTRDGYTHFSLNSKLLFFLCLSLIIAVITLLSFIANRDKKWMRFNWLDLTLVIYIFYIVIKSIIQKTYFSLACAESVGLIVIYFSLRIICEEKFEWIFLALIISGGIQALYGNLQLWGVLESNHAQFRLTGGFLNPGPLGGYLASIFPISFGFWIFSNSWRPEYKVILNSLQMELSNKTFKSKAKWEYMKLKILQLFHSLMRPISIIVCLILVITLPSTLSRSAWIAVIASVVILLAYKYKSWIRGKLDQTATALRNAFVATIFLLTSFGLFASYHMKKDSADGRFFIWKISLGIIADYPICGVGVDGFNAHYMNYQAEYFKNNPTSDEAILAGDVNYAFNEFIRQTVENGVIGCILLILIFTVALFSKEHNKTSSSSNTIITNKESKKNQLMFIMKASIFAILLFSLFSYPFSILPIEFNLVILLAFISSSKQNNIVIRYPFDTKSNLISKVFIYTTILVVCIISIPYLQSRALGLKNWKEANELYSRSHFTESLIRYKDAYAVFQNNGFFLTNYGKALSMADKHLDAIEVLDRANMLYPNTVANIALGNSNKALGNYKNAESQYLQAFNMIPSRFIPEYLLVKLYNECGENGKAAENARILIHKNVKVESEAIEEIKTEMKKLINSESND